MVHGLPALQTGAVWRADKKPVVLAEDHADELASAFPRALAACSVFQHACLQFESAILKGAVSLQGLLTSFQAQGENSSWKAGADIAKVLVGNALVLRTEGAQLASRLCNLTTAQAEFSSQVLHFLQEWMPGAVQEPALTQVEVEDALATSISPGSLQSLAAKYGGGDGGLQMSELMEVDVDMQRTWPELPSWPRTAKTGAYPSASLPEGMKAASHRIMQLEAELADARIELRRARHQLVVLDTVHGKLDARYDREEKVLENTASSFMRSGQFWNTTSSFGVVSTTGKKSPRLRPSCKPLSPKVVPEKYVPGQSQLIVRIPPLTTPRTTVAIRTAQQASLRKQRKSPAPQLCGDPPMSARNPRSCGGPGHSRRTSEAAADEESEETEEEWASLPPEAALLTTATATGRRTSTPEPLPRPAAASCAATLPALGASQQQRPPPRYPNQVASEAACPKEAEAEAPQTAASAPAPPGLKLPAAAGWAQCTPAQLLQAKDNELTALRNQVAGLQKEIEALKASAQVQTPPPGAPRLQTPPSPLKHLEVPIPRSHSPSGQTGSSRLASLVPSDVGTWSRQASGVSDVGTWSRQASGDSSAASESQRESGLRESAASPALSSDGGSEAQDVMTPLASNFSFKGRRRASLPASAKLASELKAMAAMQRSTLGGQDALSEPQSDVLQPLERADSSGGEDPEQAEQQELDIKTAATAAASSAEDAKTPSGLASPKQSSTPMTKRDSKSLARKNSGGGGSRRNTPSGMGRTLSRASTAGAGRLDDKQEGDSGESRMMSRESSMASMQSMMSRRGSTGSKAGAGKAGVEKAPKVSKSAGKENWEKLKTFTKKLAAISSSREGKKQRNVVAKLQDALDQFVPATEDGEVEVRDLAASFKKSQALLTEAMDAAAKAQAKDVQGQLQLMTEELRYAFRALGGAEAVREAAAQAIPVLKRFRAQRTASADQMLTKSLPQDFGFVALGMVPLADASSRVMSKFTLEAKRLAALTQGSMQPVVQKRRAKGRYDMLMSLQGNAAAAADLLSCCVVYETFAGLYAAFVQILEEQMSSRRRDMKLLEVFHGFHAGCDVFEGVQLHFFIDGIAAELKLQMEDIWTLQTNQGSQRVDLWMALDEALMMAVVREDVELVTALTRDFGAGGKNVRDAAGRTPLHYACQIGSMPLVRLLMFRSAADLWTPDKTGMLPFELALRYQRLELLDIVLARMQMNPAPSEEASSHCSRTALQWWCDYVAARIENDMSLTDRVHWMQVGKLLLELLQQNEATDPIRRFLLDSAAKGETARVKMLLDVGYDTAAFEEEASVMDLAIERGHPDLVKLLKLERETPPACSHCSLRSPTACLRDAVIAGSPQRAMAAIYAGADPDHADCTLPKGRSPLMSFAGAGAMEVCQLLVEYKARITRRDDFGCAAAHYGLSLGQSEVVAWLEGTMTALEPQLPDSADQVAVYLREAVGAGCSGAVWNVARNIGYADLFAATLGNTGQTLLHTAAMLPDSQVAASLLRTGAALLPRDLLGDTPLHLAARAGHAQVVTCFQQAMQVKMGAAEAADFIRTDLNKRGESVETLLRRQTLRQVLTEETEDVGGNGEHVRRSVLLRAGFTAFCVGWLEGRLSRCMECTYKGERLWDDFMTHRQQEIAAASTASTAAEEAAAGRDAGDSPPDSQGGVLESRVIKGSRMMRSTSGVSSTPTSREGSKEEARMSQHMSPTEAPDAEEGYDDIPAQEDEGLATPKEQKGQRKKPRPQRKKSISAS